MHAALLTLHAPLASAYFGGFDYDVTHFMRGLNNGGFLNHYGIEMRKPQFCDLLLFD